MSKPLHAIDYLEAPAPHPPAPVCVVFGDDAFLKRQVLTRLREEVLGGGEGDFSLCSLEGPKATLRDVIDELATVAMFGGGKRLVVVHDADQGRKRSVDVQEADPGGKRPVDVGEADEKARGFIARYRTELEDYLARPNSTGVLVLELGSWPSNTRLFRAVAAAGLAVECSTPPTSRLTRWLAAWAKKTHNAQVTVAVAEMLVEMIGPELGLLDQEVAKLAVTAGPGGKITAEMVSQMVGSWRAKTTWEMLDALLEGNLREALRQLDRLLLAGESPIAILGQISASLRRLAAATRIVLGGEATGRRIAPRDALAQAGVKPFVLDKVKRQLIQLGRYRGNRLYRWLLDADLDLKGASSLPPRTVLERLAVRLAAPAVAHQPR
jgi:DNA polymerase-3 subunit delta